MKCPKCGSTQLKVEVSFAGQVACKFDESGNFELLDDVALDSSWDDASRCECIACHWSGEVQYAKSGEISTLDQGERLGGLRSYSRPITSEELSDLKQLLSSQRCPPLWRDKIEKLISEIERLNAFLETIMRVTNQATSGGDPSNSDTVVK